MAYGKGANAAFGVGGLDAVSAAKSEALLNEISESGADMVVAPRYTVKKNDYLFYGPIHVTAEGGAKVRTRN